MHSKFLCLFFIFALCCLPLSLQATNVITVDDKDTNVSAWLIEDHSLPIIAVRIVFKNAGYAHDPHDKQGLAFMVANLLDKGAGDLDYQSFNKRLEENAIQFSAQVDADSLYIDIKTLRKNYKEAFRLLNLVLTSPQFDPFSIEQVRKQILVSIQKEREDPEAVAENAWDKAILDSHPYANQKRGLPETVRNIRRGDILKYASRRLSRNAMLLSVVGDITAEETAAISFSTFSNVTTSTPTVELPAAKYKKGKDIHLAMPVPQSVVLFGQEGVKYGHPDFYAAYVLNYILGGGGFESRLMQQVRSKKGLAYNIYSFLNSFEKGALFEGKVSTRNEAVAESIAMVRQEIKRMHDKGVTLEELDLAKKYLTGSFALKLDSNEKLARFLAFMQIEQLGTDFLKKRNDYINAVTLEEVNRVAKTLLKHNDLVFVTVGGEPAR